ncbi:MAG: hypothetical protein ABSD80_06500 [Caulobacteraceae bacterium]
MRLQMGALALSAALCFCGGALASPFDGTWKLDPARSKLTGDTFTYSKAAKGFHYSNGSTIAYDFAVDGKDYPMFSDRTVAWTAAGPNAWDAVSKAHGVVVSKAHRTLSADGKTLTASYTEFHPNGDVVHESDVFTRVSGGPGLAGEWKDTATKATADTMKISTSAANRYEVTFPAFKETMAGTIGGGPSPITGPTVPPGAQATYTAAGAGRWSYEITLKGKTYVKGALSVSADGKTLTRTVWVPGKESEKAVEIYSKL